MSISYFTPAGSAIRFTFTAETDVEMCAGCAVLVKESTHLARAQADAPARSAVAGLAIVDGRAGFAVTYASAGLLLLPDWTAITGQPLLTPGATYFLDPEMAGGMTTIPPSQPGQVVVALGEALSTTTFNIHIASPILL